MRGSFYPRIKPVNSCNNLMDQRCYLTEDGFEASLKPRRLQEVFSLYQSWQSCCRTNRESSMAK
ncbi:hypothetical protein AMECASPLE_038062, partial [Ameca splendens]